MEEHISATLSCQGRKHKNSTTLLTHKIHKDGMRGPLVVSERHGETIPDMLGFMKTVVGCCFLQLLMFPRVVSSTQNRWICLSWLKCLLGADASVFLWKMNKQLRMTASQRSAHDTLEHRLSVPGFLTSEPATPQSQLPIPSEEQESEGFACCSWSCLDFWVGRPRVKNQPSLEGHSACSSHKPRETV